MNISFPQPPDEITSQLRQDHTLIGGVSFRTAQHAEALAADSLLMKRGRSVLPHRQYTIRLDNLLQEHPIQSAEQIGWRGLDSSSEGVLASRLLAYDEHTKKADLLEINVGPFSTATAEAMERIRSFATTGQFEFRFLTLPQIYLAAVWLASAEANFFAPLAPCPKSFDAERIYKESEFVERVRILAGKVGDFDSSPR